MIRIQLLAAAICATMAFSACNSSKCYTKRFYRKAKREVKAENISRSNDTVYVVYPELAMFDFGKDEVKPEARQSMERLSKVLVRFSKIDFWVNGYTDNVGTQDANLSLSQRRADNSKMLLNQNGVSADRIQTMGMGEQHPIADNSSETGRQSNRRVELVLYKTKRK